MKNNKTFSKEKIIFEIDTKDLKYVVEAKNRKDAIKKFFNLIIKENKLGEIGQVAIFREKNKTDEISFRTVPALYYLGIFDKETALANLQLTISPDITEKDLEKMVKNDSKWFK